MSSVTHADPSHMTHNVAALFGHSDDTLIAWQQACVQAADTLGPQHDPERLAQALALAQYGGVGCPRSTRLLLLQNPCGCPGVDAHHTGQRGRRAADAAPGLPAYLPRD